MFNNELEMFNHAYFKNIKKQFLTYQQQIIISSKQSHDTLAPEGSFLGQERLTNFSCQIFASCKVEL